MPDINEISDRLESIAAQKEPPFASIASFDFDVRVEPVGGIEKVFESQQFKETHIILRWLDVVDPRVAKYEVWGRNISNQNEAPFKITEVRSSPASFSITADEDKSIALLVRTILDDGRGTDLNASPSVGTSIILDPLGSGDIGDGTIGDSKLDRSTDPIVVTSADILNATIATADIANLAVTTALIDDASITNAKIGNAAVDTAQIANLAVTDALIDNATITSAKIVSITAASILAGTITSVNMSAGTYSLISGTETMTIDGTNGFQQISTGGDANSTTIHNGLLQISDGGTNRVKISPGQIIFGNDDFSNATIDIQKDPTNGGFITLKNNSDEFGVRLEADTIGGGKLSVWNGTSTDSSGVPGVFIAGVDDNLGQTNSGYIAVSNSGGSAKIKLGIDSGGSPKIVLTEGGAGSSIISELTEDGNGGGRFDVNNASGTNRIRCNVFGSGIGGSVAVSGSTDDDVSMISGNSGSPGIFVGANQVLGAQGATISDPTGGGTVDSEARTAIDSLIDRLQAHGLIA